MMWVVLDGLRQVAGANPVNDLRICSMSIIGNMAAADGVAAEMIRNGEVVPRLMSFFSERGEYVLKER